MNRALVEAVLSGGFAFPATKAELIAYARTDGAPDDVLPALERLPERRYLSPNDVGEELAPVQPLEAPSRGTVPAPESGAPPGGDRYVRTRS